MFPREAVEACIALSVFERGPLPGVRYSAFVDPSGGSRDSFTLAVAHKQDEVTVIDCLREVRPPFSPEGVVAEFATVLRAYRIGKVTGDRYAGEFPREQFRKHGVSYEVSAQPKSDIYVNFLPLLNSGKVELLDHPRLISQLTGLERRTSRAGKIQSTTPLAATTTWPTPLPVCSRWRRGRCSTSGCSQSQMVARARIFSRSRSTSPPGDPCSSARASGGSIATSRAAF